MAKTNLSEMFGLIPKRSYWNMPDDEDLFASKIKVTDLPLSLNYKHLAYSFSMSVVKTLPGLKGVNIKYEAIPNGETAIFSIHLDAIADLKRLSAALQSELNSAIRLANLEPNYTVEAGLDESLIHRIANRNYGSDEDGPTMA